MEEKNYGIAIAIALIVTIIFFGGWYLFFGQLFGQPDQPIPNQGFEIEPSGLITSEETQ